MDQKKADSVTRPLLIRALYERPMSGAQIEARSFEIIDREAGSHNFSAEQWEIVRRLLHTTADFALLDCIKFSGDAIDFAIEALQSCRPIFTDSNMIRTLSRQSQRRYRRFEVTARLFDGLAIFRDKRPDELFHRGDSPNAEGVSPCEGEPLLHEPLLDQLLLKT